MKKLIGFAVLLLASLANAQAAPAATSRFHISLFSAESAALAAATTFDYIETLKDTNCGLLEANFPTGTAEVYGKRPTAASALPMFAISAAAAYASYRMERSHSKALRLTGHGIMIFGSVAHFSAASHDIRIQNMVKGCR